MTNNCPSCFRPYPQEYFVKIVGPPKEQIYNNYYTQPVDNSEKLKESIKNFLIQTIDQMEDKYNTILQEKQNNFDQMQAQNNDMFKQLQQQILKQQELIEQLKQEQNNIGKVTQTMDSAVTVKHYTHSMNKETQYIPEQTQSTNTSKSSIINTVDQLFQQKNNQTQDGQVTMATIQLVPSPQQSPMFQPNISIPQQQQSPQFTNQLASDIISQIQNLQQQESRNIGLQTSLFDKFSQYVSLQKYNDDMQLITQKINNIETKINEIQHSNTNTINQIQMNFNQLNVQIQHLSQSIFETQSQMQNTYKQHQQQVAKQKIQQLDQTFENMILSGQDIQQQNQLQYINDKQESNKQNAQTASSKPATNQTISSQSKHGSHRSNQYIYKTDSSRETLHESNKKKSSVYDQRPMSQISVQPSTSTQREAQTVKSTLQIIAQMSDEQVSLAASVLKKQLKQTSTINANEQSIKHIQQNILQQESLTRQNPLQSQNLRFSNTVYNSQHQKSQNNKNIGHQIDDIEILTQSNNQQNQIQPNTTQQVQSSQKMQQSSKYTHNGTQIVNSLTKSLQKQKEEDSDKIIEINSTNKSASLLVQDVQEIPKVDISSYISIDGVPGTTNANDGKMQPISDEEVISQLKKQSDYIDIQEASMQQGDIQPNDIYNTKLAQSSTPVPFRQNIPEQKQVIVNPSSKTYTIPEDANTETPPPLRQSQNLKVVQNNDVEHSQTVPQVLKNTVQEQLFVLSSTKPQVAQQAEEQGSNQNNNQVDKIPVQPFNQQINEPKDQKEESVFENSAFRTHMLQNTNEKVEVIYAPQGPKVATPSALHVTHVDTLIKQAQDFLGREEQVTADLKKSAASVRFSEIDVPLK